MVMAEPLLTISCPAPRGTSVLYGVSNLADMKAGIDHTPRPAPTYRSTPDELLFKPTFVLDSNKKNITVVYAEREKDVKLRESTTEVGAIPPSLPAAESVDVLLYTRSLISATKVSFWGVTLYSFYPELGSVFITTQGIDTYLKDGSQVSTFATCTFTWSGPH
jgi:hypothetical protein